MMMVEEKIDTTDPNYNRSLILASQTVTPNAAWNAADDSDGVNNGQKSPTQTNAINCRFR
jgi:hypothetical protein